MSMVGVKGFLHLARNHDEAEIYPARFDPSLATFAPLSLDRRPTDQWRWVRRGRDGMKISEVLS